MQRFNIRTPAHALQIVHAYAHCNTCSDCPLHAPEGLRCSYLYDVAMYYLRTHGYTLYQRENDIHAVYAAENGRHFVYFELESSGHFSCSGAHFPTHDEASANLQRLRPGSVLI